MTDATTDEIQLPAILPSNLPSPTEVSKQCRAAFGEIYTRIEAEIADATIDLTTKSGREAVASRAYKIARTKTGLQKAAKARIEEQQAIINAVNTETKTMREMLDNLRDKARAPLNQWEADEEKRVEGIKTGLATLRDLSCADATFSPDEIRASIQNVTRCFDARDWDEYQPMAIAAHEAAIAKFTSDLAASEKRIADEAELAELREQKAEHERKAEADRIEKERQDDDARKRQEAKDALAKADAGEKERQRVAAEQAKAQAEEMIQAARDRAAKAEADAKQAEIDRVAADDKAEADRIAAAENAEKDKIAAAEYAVTEERSRQFAIAEVERVAKEEREADLAHRKKINNAALKAMISCSEISTAQAKMIVQAMAKGQVPHVTISY